MAAGSRTGFLMPALHSECVDNYNAAAVIRYSVNREKQNAGRIHDHAMQKTAINDEKNRDKHGLKKKIRGSVAGEPGSSRH
jgi:hypothetical protein